MVSPILVVDDIAELNAFNRI